MLEWRVSLTLAEKLGLIGGLILVGSLTVIGSFVCKGRKRREKPDDQ